MSQVIYCLGTSSDETWICPRKKEIARKRLEEHYNKFKLQQSKEGIETAVNIKTASLKELISLPGIGPAIFAGIKYYITVR